MVAAQRRRYYADGLGSVMSWQLEPAELAASHRFQSLDNAVADPVDRCFGWHSIIADQNRHHTTRLGWYLNVLQSNLMSGVESCQGQRYQQPSQPTPYHAHRELNVGERCSIHN